ncbi:hypothetical protein B0F90DRAFT_966586 [Multifurca ochricompacta]|uniref:Uncharacterized protein n=1 Tax=Multifurca ochricompacta TaxID=376703 RepID=A0AAD4QRL8_9AGAM|nr:hypothetical protein B0F90DRAFT_966586 [Multifurca ochricompacta]
MSSQSPLHLPSWNLCESPSILDVPFSESNQERVEYASVGHSDSRHGEYHHGWGVSVPRHAYDAFSRFLERFPDLPLTPPQFADGSRRDRLDERFSSVGTYEVLYTDNATTKLGHGIRRKCFNCRETETTSWRRSMLSRGKLVRISPQLTTCLTCS